MICKRCKQDKALDLFRLHITSVGNESYEKTCKQCSIKRNNFNQKLKRYGISPGQHELMLKSQKGFCAICGKPPGKKGLGVDHCHKTEKVRGLLCTNCNLLLGCAYDNTDLLRRAIEYLEKQ